MSVQFISAIIASGGSLIMTFPDETESGAQMQATRVFDDVSGHHPGAVIEVFQKIPPRTPTVRWPANADNTGLPTPQPDADEVAGVLYGAYREAVGGRSVSGDPLPTWSELKAIPARAGVVAAWMVTARTAIHTLSTSGTSRPASSA